MKKSKPLYRSHCSPTDVISRAVRGYFRFQLNLLAIEELHFELSLSATDEPIGCPFMPLGVPPDTDSASPRARDEMWMRMRQDLRNPGPMQPESRVAPHSNVQWQ